MANCHLPRPRKREYNPQLIAQSRAIRDVLTWLKFGQMMQYCTAAREFAPQLPIT
jgi:hypothetical protein